MSDNGHQFDIQSFRNKESCHLIIVGKSIHGELFCYEHHFDIIQVIDHTIKVRYPMKGINPLKELAKAEFVEISVRERGVPYSAHVSVSKLDSSEDHCTLWLTLPNHIYSNENRRFVRLQFDSGLPMSCSVVGVRRKAIIDGVPFACKMTDISGGGLSFVTEARLFQPLYLFANFTLPHWSEEFNIYGEIARCSPFKQGMSRVALSFSDAPESVVRRIDEYCNRYS